MAITYSIDGGADAAKFNINSTTGALTFKAAPDFETPGDANGDNVYEVSVKATDAGGAASSKLVKVTVTDVSENAPPQITSAGAVSVKENQTTVMTVTATDPDDGGTPIPPEPPVAGARPGATNTGYKNAPGYPGSLTPFSGSVTSGSTYSFRSFGGLDLGSKDAPLSNITFIGCRFKGSGDVLVKLYGDNHTFRYCSFEPNVAAPPTAYAQGYQYGLCGNGGWYTKVGKLTVENCDMWGFGNGIDCIGSTQAKPHVFRNNWIHDARADGGIDHTDGIGFMGGSGTSSYVVLDNNVIESVGNTNGIAWQGGNYSYFTITNNLIGGWGYATALFTANNVKFEDNVFSTRLPCVWGPVYPASSMFYNGAGSTWKRNKWMVPDGAAWGVKSHDGWFWKPVAEAKSGNDDTKFVSQTDV